MVAYNNAAWRRGGWERVYRKYYAASRWTRRWADHVTRGDQGVLVCMVKELFANLPGCNGTYARFGRESGAVGARRPALLAGGSRALLAARGRRLRVGFLSERWNVLCWQGLTARGCTGLWRACEYDLRRDAIFYHFCNCARPAAPRPARCEGAGARGEGGALAGYAGVGLDVCGRIWRAPWFGQRGASVGASLASCDAAATAALHRRAFARLRRHYPCVATRPST